MEYHLERSGKTISRIISQCLQDGIPLPEHLSGAAPELLPGSEFWFRAFMDLSSCRAIGMDEGEIPWTAAHSYGLRHDLCNSDFWDMWTIVKELDMVYLAHKRKIANKGNNGS